MAKPGLIGERLVAVFMLGVLLLTPPFLGIFNTPVRVFGIPVLYLYLFAAWVLLIAIVAATVERSGPDDEPSREHDPVRTPEGPEERAGR